MSDQRKKRQTGVSRNRPGCAEGETQERVSQKTSTNRHPHDRLKMNHTNSNANGNSNTDSNTKPKQVIVIVYNPNTISIKQYVYVAFNTGLVFLRYKLICPTFWYIQVFNTISTLTTTYWVSHWLTDLIIYEIKGLLWPGPGPGPLVLVVVVPRQGYAMLWIWLSEFYPAIQNPFIVMIVTVIDWNWSSKIFIHSLSCLQRRSSMIVRLDPPFLQFRLCLVSPRNVGSLS